MMPVHADTATRSALASSYGYEQLVILFPADRTTVFDNDGRIDVQLVTLNPDLPGEGNRFELLLDGRRIRGDGEGRFVLRNVRRGAHWLRARIVTPSGATVIDSLPVRFYKWHPARANASGDSATP